MSKQFITDIIKEEYKKWLKDNIVLIEAGTGCGKSYFIKNELNTYCMSTGQNILYLTNRDTLKEQVKNDIGNFTNITIKNYQKIESFMLNGTLKLDNYDYVVCDEAHYFFTDASFSRTTDLFLTELLKDDTVCKIFMTATPWLLKLYIEKEKFKIDYDYILRTDYSYLNKIVAFNTYETIDSIIEEIPQDEQIIFFSSAKKALEISKKYNGTFICSKRNKDGLWNKYIESKKEKNEKGEEVIIETENYKEIQSIIQNGTFKNHILCTTTALDNGVNIKENTPVKHIIIDILDRDEFIQCLGRKRVSEGEKINLYFYGWKNDGRRINGFKKKIGDSINKANLLFNEGEEIYVNTKFKNDRFTDGRIIDDVTINGELHKRVNKCVYLKYKNDLTLYDSLVGKNYKLNFKSIIATNLKIKSDNIIEWETKDISQTFEEFLDSIVGIKMFKEEQKILKERFGEYGLKARSLGINTLNGYIKDKKLPFIIKTDERKSYRDDNGKVKKEKSHWILGKIIF
ncbi:DEAD/DEAH box helicase [Clostridium brassicae]|uniref:DEAD/DEAH box helicase n=1 Tax=Clostridium brassicae TaxID=2999072 RepID=A0ABT4D7Q6_9CLOT|nr:DEAD/DEAH box helicase [Clostridium brassicae]MCY6958295.1 DEAD/DEAH box helicase [Clostridium brassicae]